MKVVNISSTRTLNLCVSCEICRAICPVDAISMEYSDGQFLPCVNEEYCTGCGLCRTVCPGINIDPYNFESITHMSDGPILDVYNAASKNAALRHNSTSGGIITQLLINLITDGTYDAAFVLDFTTCDGKPAGSRAVNTVDEIINAAGSKYIPVSVYNQARALLQGDGMRYVIVGTPCQIRGLKKCMEKNNVQPEDAPLFFGLFCDMTMNFNVVRFFEDVYGKTGERLVKFKFRTKEQHGWPGHTKLYFNSGRELIVDRKIRMQLKKYFQLHRCLYCCDKLNSAADISFGDCYVEGKSTIGGTSSVIVRTAKGKEIFDRYSHLFVVERETIQNVRHAQKVEQKKDNLAFARLLVEGELNHSATGLKRDAHAALHQKIRKLQTYIDWGMKYRLRRIRMHLLMTKLFEKWKRAVAKIYEKVQLVAIFVEAIMQHLRKGHKDHQRIRGNENIVIVGGNLENKGAQAMTFTLVARIISRFPHRKVYLFSSRPVEHEDKLKDYNFKITHWDRTTRMRLFSSFLDRIAKKNPMRQSEDDRTRSILRNTDCFIDISGYALSAQMGFLQSLSYLLNIMIAKKYACRFYVLPQSIGPFDYPVRHRLYLYPLMSLYLKYPLKIFAREKEGLLHLSRYTKNNTVWRRDIVLSDTQYEPRNIFKCPVVVQDVTILGGAVGIIPNRKVFDRISSHTLCAIYKTMIRLLREHNKTVYVLRHSQEDLEICTMIKELFPDDGGVQLLSDNLNAIELENAIKKFDFVVASRYHSVIHAYRNGVPALVIGWAAKYRELLNDFDQLDYYFDVRQGFCNDQLYRALVKLLHDCQAERSVVTCRMRETADDSVFAVLDKEGY